MRHKFNVKQWILVGILIRFILVPFTMHTDIIFIHQFPHLLYHGQWNVYEIAEKSFNSSYYPAITLFVFAFFDFVFCSLFSSYEAFIHSLSSTNLNVILNSENIFSSLMLIKTPYFIFEALTFLVGMKMIKNDNAKKKFAFLMATNPLIIYSLYLFGQFDLLPAYFLLVAGFFALRNGQEHFGSIAIACGFMSKIFPIIFFPLFLLIAADSIKKAIKLILYFLLPILVIYPILYLINGDSIFFIFKKFSYNLNTTQSVEHIFIRFFQVTTYGVICWHAFFVAKKQISYPLLAKYFLATYMAAYWGLNIHFTHYLIWQIPFFILLASFSPEWEKKMYIFIFIIFLAGLRARSSFIGLFAPLNPEFFLSLPSLKDITGFIFDQSVYDRWIGYIFNGYAGLIVYWILKDLFSKQNNKTSVIEN
jgi:hypothetical protein